MFRLKTQILVIACALCYASSCRAAYPNDALNDEAPASLRSPDLYAPSGSLAPQESGAIPGPGMEVVPVGGLNIIGPKGMRIRKEGSQIIFEDIGEYLGRRLQGLEDKVRVLEEAQRDMDLKIHNIEKKMAETTLLQSSEQKVSDDDLQ